jgi:hypothetical protein
MALSSSQENISLNSLAAIRRIEDQFILSLEKTMRKLERNLTDFINENRNAQIIDTALARRNIQNVLTQSGYFKSVGDLLNEGYQATINKAQEVYNKLYGEQFQFQDVSLQQLNALKNLDLDQFSQLSGQAVTTMNRVMNDLQFGSITFNQAVEVLRRDIIDKLERHAKTWVTTGLSGIYRESTVALASDNGITKFQYVGPLDGVTRSFCRRYVGSVKTEKEWNSLNNGQITPVMTYGGGYNCRHTFIGVIERKNAA